MLNNILSHKVAKISIVKKYFHNESTIHFVETPIVLHSLKGNRNVNNNNTLKKELNKLKSEYDSGQIDEDTYKSKTKELKDFTEKANQLPKEVASNDVKKGQKNIAHKGSPEEEAVTDNIESDLSETESYTNSDTHSGLFENLMNKISEGFENLKEKIVDTIDDIKLEFDIYKDYTLPRDWENFKENMFTKAGEIKENTHNIISNTFKGSTTEIHRYTIRDIAEHPELMDNLSIEEIKQIDVSMCPELEEFLKTPPDEVPDGLMDNILEELPEGFGVGDETLYETLKGVVQNATDMMG